MTREIGGHMPGISPDGHVLRHQECEQDEDTLRRVIARLTRERDEALDLSRTRGEAGRRALRERDDAREALAVHAKLCRCEAPEPNPLTITPDEARALLYGSITGIPYPAGVGLHKAMLQRMWAHLEDLGQLPDPPPGGWRPENGRPSEVE